MPPKLILLLLFITATLNVNAQLTPKDTTVTHDSTIYKLTKNVKPVPYDSAYKTPIRDTSVLVPIMHVDSSGKKVKSINCYWKKKLFHKKKWVCDTTWQKLYDTTTTLVSQPTKTLPRDTSSYFCCVDSIWYTSTPQIISTTHDSVVYRDQPVYLTRFGAKLQKDNTQNQITVMHSLNMQVYRPNAIPMQGYISLPNSLSSFLNANFFCIVNVSAFNTSGDNIVTYLHGADTIWYKANLDKLGRDIQATGKADSVDVAIENEPINRQYYTGNFNDYIAQLRMSVQVLSKYKIKVVSGCVHLQLCEALRDGASGDSRIDDTRSLLNAEKTNGVAYTNVHDSYEKTTGGFKVPDFVNIVTWVGNYTGHQVISNEISQIGATALIATQYMDLGKQAKMPFFLFWSGDVFNGVMPADGNSKGDALNKGLILSDIGKAVSAKLKIVF